MLFFVDQHFLQDFLLINIFWIFNLCLLRSSAHLQASAGGSQGGGTKRLVSTCCDRCLFAHGEKFL